MEIGGFALGIAAASFWPARQQPAKRYSGKPGGNLRKRVANRRKAATPK